MMPSMKLSKATAGVRRKRERNQDGVSTKLTNCPHPSPTTPSVVYQDWLYNYDRISHCKGVVEIVH